jgi:gliding motility-associated-like protein
MYQNATPKGPLRALFVILTLPLLLLSKAISKYFSTAECHVSPLTKRGAKRHFSFQQAITMLLVLLSSFSFNTAYAQRTYASGETHTSSAVLLGSASVTNPGNVVGNTPTTFAALKVGGVVGGSYASITPQFPAAVAANTPVYIKIGTPAAGGLLGLIGGGFVNITAYNGGTAVSSTNVVAVTDASGGMYYSITPSTTYDRVEIKLSSSALLGNAELDVYDMFYGIENTANCGKPYAVATTASGISLLGGITNPLLAIDGNENTNANLNLGLVAVLGTQSISGLFSTTSTTGDAAKVIISIPASLLSLDLINNITIEVYNGGTSVGKQTVNNLLTVDLLNLFGNNAKVPVYFYPTGTFDQVKVTFGSLVGAGLAGSLNVYEIERVPGKPVIQNSVNGVITSCPGSAVTLGINNPPSGVSYSWYDAANPTTVLSTASSYSPPGLSVGNTNFFVLAKYTGCTYISDTGKVTVTIQPLASAADIKIADTSVCVGNLAVVTPTTTTITGTPVFRWYKDATATQAITNGLIEGNVRYAINPTTGALSVSGLPAGSVSYYVSVSGNNKCENAPNTLKAVNITVTTSPPPPVVTSAFTISTGQTVVLSAQPVSGATIEWYTDTTAASVFTGTNYTVGPFSTPGVYKYFAGVRLAGGCESFHSMVTVTVTGPVTPVPDCNVPTSQVSGTTLGCLLCSIENPTYSIDSDTTNATSLHIPVGLLGGSAYQQLIFSNPGAATDSIRITLGSPTGLADLTILGSTQIQVLNGATVTNTVTLNNLLTVRLLSGNKYVVTVPAGGAFNSVQIKLTGVANVLNTLNIYGARIISPTPTAITNNVTVCQGQTANLSATPAAGTSVRWYDANRTMVSNQNSFTTAALNTPGVNTFYLLVIGTNNCANPDTIKVLVNVNALGTPADVSIADTFTVCSNADAVLKPTAPNVTGTPVFNWYQDANRTQPITNGLVVGGITYTLTAGGQLTVAGVGATAVTVYVSVSGDNRCENAAGNLKKVTVTSTTGGAAPPITAGNVTAGLNEQIVLQASSTGGATIVWYADNVTPTPAFIGSNYTVGPFAAPQVITYYVASRLPGGCESTRVPVVLTISSVVNPATGCNTANSQQSGTTFGCVLCDVVDPTFSIDNDPTNFTHLSAPVNVLGGAVYQQLIFPASGTATDSIRLIMAAPQSLADVSLLGGIELKVFNGTTVVSTRVLSSVLSVRLLTGQQYSITIPSGGAFTGVQVKITGTLGLLNSLDIYGARIIAPNPTAVTNNVTVCAGQPAALSATLSAGTTAKWYTDSLGSTVLSSQPTYTTDSLKTAGTFTYYLQIIGSNNCPNPARIPVKVTVTPLSTPADITVADTTTTCGSGNAVIVPTATGITNPVFNWYKDSLKTKLITNGLTDPTGVNYAIASNGTLTVSGLSVGTVTYYVSVSGTNKCDNAPGNLKAAVVKVTTAPVSPVVAGNVVTTTGQQVALTAAPVANGTINWYADSTTTTIAGSGTSFNVGPFTTPGNYTFFAGVSVPGGCNSARVPVVVTVTGPVIPPTACNVPTSQTAGTTLGCILCSVINPTNDIDKDTTNFTRLNIPVGLVGGSVYQQLMFPSAGNATDSIRLFLGSPVGLADVGLLSGVEFTVFNGSTAVSKDTLSQLLNLRLLGGNQYAVTIPAKGVYTGVQIKLTGAVSLLTSLDIYGAKVIYPNATVNTTTDTTCIGTKATLSVTPAPGSNTAVKWYADSTSSFVLSNQNTYITDTLRVAGTVTYYVQVVGANGCPNPDRIPVRVVVTPAPALPVVQSADITICAGSDAVLAIVNPDHKLKYNWYNVPVGGTKLNSDSGYTYKVVNVTANATYYVEAVSTCGAVSARKAIQITIGSSLAAPTVTPSPATVIVGQQAILTAKATIANAILVWYGSQSGTDSLFTGAVFAAPAQTTLGTTTYWVEARLAGSSTCNSARTAVNVNTVSPSPDPVPCEGATTQTVGGSGLLVLGNVYNPGLAVDNLASTGSSLVIDLGLLNASVWEKVGFNGPSSPGDTVRVLLENPSQILSAAVLASVQLTTYLGNTAGDSIQVSNPLINLKLLSNSHQALLEFVPTKTFDAVQVKLKSGVLGALTAINFNYAQRALVTPTVAASNVEICSGATATLNVKDPVAGITYRWYNATGVYQAGKDGTSFTTPVLTANTTYSVQAYKAAVSCASASMAKVTITVLAVPPAPTVLSTSVQVCSGSDAELAVTNPAKGFSYSWFNVPTGGTKLNTDSGFTYKVINVTAPATYYVEAVNDSCNTKSATRTAVLVTPASGLTAPTVTPSPANVGIGEQAVLTAKAAANNVNFYWFASQTSTDTLFKGAVFLTPAQQVANVKTYWVEVALNSGTGCKSARTSVNVNTQLIPFVPIPCENGSSQSVGGGGLLVLGNVYNPQLVIDDNANTGSSLVIDLGVLNASVWQRVGFVGTSTPNDTVRVLLENPGQVLSAALLASVQLTTYLGNTPGDSLLVSNPAIHLNLLNGNKQALISFVPAKPFNMVEVKLKSGVIGALTAINFNYAQRAIAQPKVQSANASVCVGKTVAISVQNPVAGVTYQWFDNQGTKVKDSTAYVVPATLAPGVYNYLVTASRNNCASSATKVQVTVLAAPVPPTPATDNPTTTCVNTAVTLKVNVVAGVTYNWYDAAVGGTQIVTNNSSYTTPANLAVGTYNYYVAAINAGNCSSSTRTKITLTVNGGGTAVDINAADQTICVGDNGVLTPTSTTVANPVFKWYKNADKTNPITAGVAADGVLTITAPAAGTYTYYVSVTGTGTCENAPNALKAVKLTVTAPATAADITAADQTICEGNDGVLTPSSTTVTNPVFKWYANADKTGPITTGIAVNGVLTITKPAAGTYTYYVSVTGSNKCENAANTLKAVKLTVNATATAADVTAADQNICQGSDAVLTPTSTTVTAPVFKWYAKADKTSPITTGVAANGVLTITGLAAGNYTYYVSVSGNNKCENAANVLKAVLVSVGQPGKASDITAADQTICVGENGVLTPTSTTVTAPVFKWYKNADKTGLITTGVAADGVLTITAPAAGTYTYYVSVTGTGTCENAPNTLKAVKLTVTSPATAADITAADQTICEGSNGVLTPTSTTVTNPVFKWYANADKTGPITTGVAANGVLTITKPVAGTYTYYVSVTGSNKCENAANALKAVKLTVNASATAADINVADQVICQGSNVILTPTSTTVTNPVFKWYANADKTLPITEGVAANGVLTITGLTAGDYTYFVSVSGSNKCENVANALKGVLVTVGKPGIAGDITAADQTICTGSNGVLTPTSTTVTNPVFKWYNNPDKTSPITTGVAANGVLTLTGLSAGTYTKYVSVTGTGTCENAPNTLKAVNLFVTSPAISTDIKADNQNICEGDNATLTPTSTTVTNPVFKWYANADKTGPITAGVDANGVLTVNGLSASANPYTFFVSVTGSNKCENASGTLLPVLVTVNKAGTAIDINAADQTICAGGTAVFTPTSTTVTNPVFKWYANADRTNPITTGVDGKGVLTVSGLAAGTYTYYVSVFGSNKCENAPLGLKAVKVTVTATATAADITADNQVICEGTDAILTPSSTTVTNPVFKWYANADKTGPIITNVSANGVLTVTGLAGGTYTYYVSVSGSNRCENVAGALKAVQVKVNTGVQPGDVTVDPQSDCVGESVVLTPRSGLTAPTFLWYANPTRTTPITRGVDANGVLTITGLAAGSYTYYVSVSSTDRCGGASGPVKAVAVKVNEYATSEDIKANDISICAGRQGTLTATSTTVTNPSFTWYTDAALTNPVAFTATYTTPPLSAATRYYVTVKGDNRCANKPGTAKVVAVSVDPSPLPPASIIIPTQVCAGTTATLAVENADESLTYRWYDEATGGTALGEGNTFTTRVLTATITYYVESVVKAGGCISLTRTPAQVIVQQPLAAPIVTAGVTTATSVTFSWNAIPGAIRYEVTLDNGTTFMAPSSGPTGTTHTITGLSPNQTVTIRVRAVGNTTCETSALSNAATNKAANPQGNNIFVPNLFSPNGDGVNDVLLVYSTSIRDLEFRVYNQWGQLVFTSKDQRQGWDGTMSGQKQPLGVYVYALRATMTDGTIVNKKGNVTLMR